MTRQLLISLSLFLFSFAALAQPDPSCIKRHAREIKFTTSDDYADLAFLKKDLAGKRIVLLGESSHGIGDYYALKSRIVKYLHEELGFEVLAMESGIGDVFATYRQIDSLSAKRLRNNTVYGNFQCAEIMPLFEHIKETAKTDKPLIFAGFDSQNFSASLEMIYGILKTHAPSDADNVLHGIQLYYKIPGYLWEPDRAPLFAISDTIRSAAVLALKVITEHKADICAQYKLNELGFSYLERVLINHRESSSIDWNTQDPTVQRDSLMADNLCWLMEKVYPDKKFIVWGHNGHIDKAAPTGNPYKWMGHYIKEKFGSKSYHIGLFAREGQTFEWWTKTNRDFLNDKPDDIEALASPFGISYFAFRKKKACGWYHKPSFGFEVENGGRIGFVPDERFDAVIVLRKVGLPTY